MPATASCFRFHACFAEADVVTQGDSGYPAQYIHHFFPDPTKLTCSEDFECHINFLPITFDTFINTRGTIGDLDTQNTRMSVVQALEQMETFPGGFVKCESDFKAILRRHRFEGMAIEPPQKRQKQGPTTNANPAGIKVAGQVVSRIAHKFDEGTGPNLFWVIEAAVSPVDHSNAGKPPEDPNSFPYVHRRMEWFLHFYIDAMSSIQLEPRWRLFLPIRFFTDPDPLEIVTKEAEASRKEELTNGESLEGQLQRKADNVLEQWPSVDSERIESFKLSLAGLQDENYLRPTQATEAFLQTGRQPFEILGLVTVFQFFALPRDRARISQFFIFPHRQRIGLGREVLSAVMDKLGSDDNIREIAVEDPAPGFQRVRDTVSIDQALSRGLLRRECLYPEAEVAEASAERVPWAVNPVNPTNWPRYSEVLKRLQKETPIQRRRLWLLLSIARHIPSDVLKGAEPKASASDSQRTKGTGGKNMEHNCSDALMQWQKTCPQMTDIRVTEKRRFRLESVEWYSSQRTLQEVQGELEAEWLNLFQSLCSSIKAIRRRYPLIKGKKDEN